MDVSRLKQGIYFLKLETELVTLEKKIIIK
ncbi:MAG: T9SS type A sorting domain-containing protein [Winogradskyella sp.]|nr:T9SS type A sorting domain-containing protein [Winogradskyella sp.]NNK22188.1 T9SS type A sorting domain-containing protein [Winogradskyella sp.]